MFSRGRRPGVPGSELVDERDLEAEPQQRERGGRTPHSSAHNDRRGARTEPRLIALCRHDRVRYTNSGTEGSR
jgi:hypothetical protein